MAFTKERNYAIIYMRDLIRRKYSKGVPFLNTIPKISVGDVLELKKKHPCGAKNFLVARLGSDVRIICTGCERDMVLPRIKLEKAIKKIISTEETKK